MTKIEIIKARVSITDILLHFNININSTNRISCICQAHKDNHPSMKVDINKNRVHCFSCGFSGDVVDVVVELKQCNKKEAIMYIDKAFRLGLGSEFTAEEKQELAKIEKLIAYKKKKELEKEMFFNKCIEEIVIDLRFYEKALKDIEIKKGEYRSTWATSWGEIYFQFLKRVEWLNWLYYTLCGFDTSENNYSYIYGTNGTNVLKKIYQGEIKI